MACSELKSDLLRLASYRSLSDNGAMVFCTRLSRLGYIYSGHSLEIECNACRFRVQIHHDWLITRSRLGHESGCVFESLLNDLESEFAGVDLLATQYNEERTAANHGQFDCKYALETDGEIPENVGGAPRYATDANVTSLLNFGFAVNDEFQDTFQPEYFGVDSLENLNYKSSERHCNKNSGHFGYFNTNSLKPEQIPTQFRCIEMLNVLKVMSDLTVRIIVSTTSRHRSNGIQHKVTVGTGFVIEKLGGEQQNGETSSWKSMLNKTSREKDGLVFIQTSRHLVYNDEEAQNTVVEFFYDSPDRKDIVSLEGKYLLNSTTPGDSQCLLVCECSDSEFMQRINQLQQEFFALSERLSLKAKKGMSKKLFMIHHPHGGPKVVSYGDYTVVQYICKTDGAGGRPQLTRVTKHSHVGQDVSEYRKTLFYAADTCPGSCGAPILTFRPRQSGENGDVIFKLDIWMHNGVETSHKLGASNLKACTLPDIEQTTMNVTQEDLTATPDKETLDSQKVDQLSHKFIGLAAHPDFSKYEARIASFETWRFGHIQLPERLASSGFFHTGGGDRVRCFQCGIGLRSWKIDDDIKDQHRKHSPLCPQLISSDHPGTTTTTDSGRNSTEIIEIKLLEAENRKLQEHMMCKVCFKSEIKDVFLPCGELYACNQCSKNLTHCPSCKKQILATVTVYLT